MAARRVDSLQDALKSDRTCALYTGLTLRDTPPQSARHSARHATADVMPRDAPVGAAPPVVSCYRRLGYGLALPSDDVCV